MGSRKTVGLALMAATIAVGAGAGSASAAGPATFLGSCKLPKVNVTADSPAGSLFYRQANTRFAGSGTCTGSANGTSVSSAPAGLDVTVRGGLACLRGSDGALLGSGTFTLPGATLKVNASITIDGAFYKLVLTGSSGRADGSGITDFVGTATEPPISSGPLGCPFEKFDHAPISMKFGTSSTLVSLP